MKEPWVEYGEDSFLIFRLLSATKESDKLPALSGLAQQFAKIGREGYLAGLWSGSLLEDLIFTRGPNLV